MSGETCLTLPFRRRFTIAKSRRIVRIESEKSGKCHSIIVHSYRLHTFNHCFPCGYGFNPTKKGKKTVERDLNSVRHVFVGFVEGRNPESGIRNRESGIRNPESGIRNPECGIRNPFNVTCWSILYSFILSLLAETRFALQ